MFVKKKCVYENQVLRELLPFMEEAMLNHASAIQTLNRLCGILGEDMDCIVTADVKGGSTFLFTTLPEDEARYYRDQTVETEPACRIKGKKILRMKLEVKGILEGWWLYEVPESLSVEDTSACLYVASAIRWFLYGCFLAQECEKRAETDCFTGLPSGKPFERDLDKRLSGQEQGFLIVIRAFMELPKPYREDGISLFLIRMADVCTNSHPDSTYRIGPDMLAVLCREEKEEVYSLLQEWMGMFPESSFFLAPLSELDVGSVYTRIQKGVDALGREKRISDDGGIFPRLPLFQEGV